ncbi:MAG: GEVED domain-containing protein, partial [Flavobacterium sp.]
MKQFYLTKKINSIVSTILILLGLKEESVGLASVTRTSTIDFTSRNRFGIYSFKAALAFLFLVIGTGSSIYGQVTQRGSFTTAVSTTSTLTIAKPTGVVAGDVMIVNISQYTSAANSTAPTATGWTKIVGGQIGTGTTGTKCYGAVLYRVADGSEGSTISFTLSNASKAIGNIVAFYGVDGTGGVGVGGTGSGPFDGTTGSLTAAAGTGSSIAPASITTTAANSAVIMFGMCGYYNYNYSAWSTTSPGTLTQLYSTPDTSTYTSVGAAWATKASAGATGAGSVTLSGSSGYKGGVLIALKAAAVSAPTITGLSSTTLCPDGVQTITITGTGFTGVNTTTGVKFNGTNATVVVNSATSITATVPVGATAGNVTVTNAGGTSAGTAYTVNALPTIGLTSSLSVCGVVNTTLTASGASTYAWSPSTALSATTGSSVTANPSSTTSYTVTGTSTGGCTASNSVTIAVVSFTGVSATASASLSTVCSGSPTSLSVSLSKSVSTVVASGTATSSSYTSCPFNSSYGNMKQQHIILASELTSAGYSAGNITALGFDFVTGGYAMSNLSFNLGLTSATTIPTAWIVPTNGFTNVYNSSSYTPVSSSTNTFTFSTPFYWDGTSNIVIQTCFGNSTTTSVSNTILYNSSAPTQMAYYYNTTASTSASICGTTSIYAFGYTYRPKITITANLAPVISSVSWSNGTNVVSTSNPATVNPTTTTTYSPTITVGSCAFTPSPSVTVTVNALPTAPTTTNSSQCGSGVPTCSASGASAGQYRWYTASSGGTAISGETNATLSTYVVSATTTLYVAINNGTCESTRTAVTVTVSAADTLTAAASQTANVCLGSTVTLSYTQAGGNGNTYATTWSSNNTGNGLNATSGTPVTATPTAAGTFTYNVNGSESGTGCAANSSVTVTVINPNAGVTASASASLATVCAGSPTVLTATLSKPGVAAKIGSGTTIATSSSYTGQTAYPTYWGNGRHQYIILASELTAAGFSAGNFTGISYNVSALGSPTSLSGYTIKIGSTSATSFSSATFLAPTFTTVYGPTTYTPTLGTNTHTFTANFNWDGTSNIVYEICFGAGTGGTTSATMDYTTTSFNSVAYYYSDSVAGCGASASGTATTRPNITFTGVGKVSASSITWTNNVDSTTATTNPVTVSPTSNTTYTASIINGGCAVSPAPTVTIAVNALPSAPTTVGSTQCGTGVPTATVTSTTGATSPLFKWYAAATGGSALQSSTSPTYSTAVATTTTFYVAENNGTCDSARTAVTVTVNTPPALTLTVNQTICNGAVGTLAVTSTSSNYNSYVWTPITGLFTNNDGTGTYTTGTNASTVYVKSATAGSTTYTVNASDSTTGCATTGTTTVVILPAPTVTTATAKYCLSGTPTVALSATTGYGAGTIAWGFSTNGTSYTPISGATGTSYTAGSAITENTYYQATISDSASNVCSTPSTLITVNNPTATVTGTYSRCGTGPVTLSATASAGATLNWYSTATGGTSLATGTTYTPTVSASTNYYIEASIGGGTATGLGNTSIPTSTGASAERGIVFNATSSGTIVSAQYYSPTTSVTNTVTVRLLNGSTFTQIGSSLVLNINQGATAGWYTMNLNLPVTAGNSYILLASFTQSVNRISSGADYTSAAFSNLSPLGTITSGYDSSATTASYNYFHNIVVTTGCTAASRVQVPVTVNAAPSVTLTPTSTTTCTGVASGTVNIDANGTGSSYDTFAWSPSTGVVGNSSNGWTFTPSASGTYVLSASQSAGSCATTTNFVVTARPLPIVTVAPTVANICSGTSTTLTASSPSSLTLGAGADTTTLSTTGTPYRTGNTAGNQFKNQFLILASELTTAGLSSGSNINSLTLNVVGSGGGTLSNLTIKLGNTTTSAMTTTYLSGLTQVYTVSTWPATGTLTTGLQTHNFNTPFTWDGTSNIVIEVCAQLATTGSAGTLSGDTTPFISHIYNNPSTTGCSTTTSTTASVRPQIVLGFAASAGLTYAWNDASNTTGATLTVSPSATTTYTVSATDTYGCIGTKAVTVNVFSSTVNPPTATNSSQCGAKVPTASVASANGYTGSTFKWYADNTTTTALQTSTSATYTTSISTTTTFYVSEVSPAGCGESTRTAVTVTVNTPATVAISGTNSVCAGASTTLTASGAATYVWSPSLGLNGTTTEAVVATPSATTTYSVTGVDANGCTTAAKTITVTVNPYPSAVSIAQGATSICQNGVMSLTATGGTYTGTGTILSENFNTTAPGWTVTNGTSSPTVSNWSLATAPYTDTSGSATFTSFSTTNGGQFAYANADAGGSGTTTNTILTSPSFSTVGYSSANLTFEQGYRYWSSGDTTVKVQISSDGGTTWADLADYKGTDQGTTTNGSQTTTNKSISLASYLNQSNLKIRYNYVSTWGYYWILDNVVISGNNSATVAITWSPTTDLYTNSAATIPYTGGNATVVYVKPSTSSATTYTASAALAGCAVSATTTFTPVAAPAITTSANATICNGSSTTLTASADSSTFAWSPSSSLSAATGDTVTANPTVTTVYTVKATGISTGCSASADVTVTVNQPVTGVSISPTSSSTIRQGQSTTFTVAASGSPLTYQWQVNDGSGWVNITAASTPTATGSTYANYNSAVLTIANAQSDLSGYTYQCIITSDLCGSATSNPGTLNVDTTSIDTQPSNTNVCLGNTATFTVAASSTNPSDQISYNWEYQIGTNGWIPVSQNGLDATYGLTFGGFDSANLTVAGATTTLSASGIQVHALINGYIPSTDVTLTVKTAPSVTADPTDQTVCSSGGTATFSATATGDNLTYLWQFSTDGTTWSTYTGVGATTASIAIVNPALSANGTKYRVVVSGNAACTATASAAATLFINNPTVSTQPVATTVIIGSSATVTVATAADSPTYQWQYSANGTTGWNSVANGTPSTITYSGATTNALTITSTSSTAASSANYVRAIITSGGCTVISNAVQITVKSYCIPTNATSTSSYFGAFSTTGGSTNITNTNASFPTNGYVNNTSKSASQILGQSINYATTLVGTTVGVAIWVDWNQNGIFETTEKAAGTTGYVSTFSGSFTVPSTALLGSTRMRIKLDYNSTTLTDACAAYSSGRGETEDYTFTVLPVPPCTTAVAGTIAASPASICISGTTTLTATGYSTGFTGLTFQWYNGSGAISGATSASYTTPTLTTGDSYYFRATCANGGTTADSNTVAITVNNPQVTSTTPATRCGTGTVALAATGSTGATLNWYAAATGGTALASGTSFTTPTISATTTYYVEPTAGSGATQTSSNGTPTVTTSTTNTGLVLDITTATTLTSLDVYSTSAGTVTMQLVNSSGTVIAGPTSGTVIASTITNPQTINLGWSLPVGTGYKILVTSQTGALGYHSGTFPSPLGNGVGNIVTGATSTGTTTLNYFLYNLRTTTSCKAATRTAVTATVTPAPSITATANQTICNGAIATLTATNGSGASYDTFTWSPATNLFTNADGTGAYTAGTNAATVYATSATASSITYTVTATSSSDPTGCSTAASSTIVILPNPTVIGKDICISGTPSVALSPSTGYTGGTISWGYSLNGSSYTAISGANVATYTAGSTTTTSAYYQATIKDGSGTTCSTPSALITVNNPLVTATTPGTRCGTGNVDLSAVGSTGTTLNWYAAATGGTALGTGSVFTTPTISATTTYYVEPSVGGSTFNIGQATDTASNLSSL